MESLLSLRDVHRASHLLDDSTPSSSTLDLVSLRGRLSELCGDRGHPQISVAVDLIAQAHGEGEPAAWIGPSTSLFYPFDAADWAIDWSALALIRLDRARRALRGADKLLRSGAFGLVVIDLLGIDDHRFSEALPGRLLRLAKRHDSAVVLLTSADASRVAISSLISFRARIRWREAGPHRLRATLTITKDKRRGPGHQFCEVYDGPLGLH